ncbi:hypothetical protein DSL72_006944 [Monilinia vaccinii-corymbosi]|uniref:DUF614 domain protein n=1 Tax=Monilinia vaccinii-corymbosi TaxID=61207 RepID=A0A8A3PKD2_9HELO|nr:hypothetical protein DSL72_006944 [Monilinia vaccinii-corymbosi]
MATRIAAAKDKRKLAKNPPVTRYNLDTTTPVHRQSLAMTTPVPAKIESKQPGSAPLLRYAIPDQPQRSEPSLNRNKSEHKGQSDWMVPFCHNPANDRGTVYAGMFAPCVLYGKTHWRLKSVSLGRDPHEVPSSNNCNSMCWVHCALTVTCCLSVGLTVVQRARIRAQYRINGTMGNDVVKSLFCGPCAMMQHDREVRAREGDTRLAKHPEQYIPQMSQTQPQSLQPMRYPSSRATSAENPGTETRIFKKDPSGKLPNRYTDSGLQKVPAEAVPSTSQLNDSRLSAQILKSQHNQNCEMVRNRMQTHKLATNPIDARSGIGKVDGTTSSKLKPRVSSERNSLASLTNCITLVDDSDSSTSSPNEPDLKGCEKLSRMAARGQLSYIHDFSDYSATRIVLDHYADEERDLQENGTVRRHVNSGEGNAMRLVLDDIATRSIRSSSSSTIRQQRFQNAAVETLLSDFINQNRIDGCDAESVDSAWLLDMPVQHRISSCSVTPRNPSSIRESLRGQRIASCPATPETSTTGTSVSSVAKYRMLSCTVETAPPPSSSSSAMQEDISSCKIDITDDSGFSTPLIQHSQYGHLLEEDTPESTILISASKCRASSFSAASSVAAYEQKFLEGYSTVSDDSSPASVKQQRVSSCCASIPSSGTPNEGYGSHALEDCNFTNGSSTPVPIKQHRLTSSPSDSFSFGSKSTAAKSGTVAYVLEDGCLLSGAASPTKQHCAEICDEISSTSNGTLDSGSSMIISNEFEDGSTSPMSSTPKLRQHRLASYDASSTITECEEHLLEDCDYDSEMASLLLQHNIADCDANPVLEQGQGCLLTAVKEEQEHLLEDCVGDSGPSTPLRQHRIASCVVSSPSSRNSVVEQNRIASCPGNIPDAGIRSQSLSRDSDHLSHSMLADASENGQSIHTNYEDCLHTLEECITPADRAKMEANSSQSTEYEKYSMRVSNRFNEQPIEFNEKLGKGKEMQRSRLNDIASREGDAEFTLTQALSLEAEVDTIRVTQIDGDGTMSIASRSSVAPPAPAPSPSPTPTEHSNMIGAYPSSITPLSIKRDRKRLPSEHSSAGSGFASYFGFGGSKKTQAFVIGVGNTGHIGHKGGRRGGNRRASKNLGMVVVEPVQVEEVELEEM